MAVGAGHPSLVPVRLSECVILVKAKRFDGALPLCRFNAATARATVGSAYPYTAMAVNAEAVWFKDQNRWAEARPLLEACLPVVEASIGAAHPQTAATRANLEEARRRAP
jgi:hypothetical protein